MTAKDELDKIVSQLSQEAKANMIKEMQFKARMFTARMHSQNRLRQKNIEENKKIREEDIKNKESLDRSHVDEYIAKVKQSKNKIVRLTSKIRTNTLSS